MLFVALLIKAAEEIDGFEIFTPTELVGNPCALLPRVVEIKHRCDRIHPQAVDVIFVQPEHGARHQKAAYLSAAIVEDERLPVGMKALALIRVLIEMRAVAISQTILVGGEARWPRRAFSSSQSRPIDSQDPIPATLSAEVFHATVPPGRPYRRRTRDSSTRCGTCRALPWSRRGGSPPIYQMIRVD